MVNLDRSLFQRNHDVVDDEWAMSRHRQWVLHPRTQ